MIKTVMGALLKPFEIVVTPIAERVAGWLKRKPRLHVHYQPLTAVPLLFALRHSLGTGSPGTT